MYGHGVAPPTRSTATVINLRVLFVAAGFLSCGILTCVPLFRVAVLRGRHLDWWVAWVSLPLSIVLLMLTGALPESDFRSGVTLTLLFLGAGSAVYYLVMDIRFHKRLRQYGTGGPLPPLPMTMPNGGTPSPYGYPQPGSPYASTPVPQMPGTPVPQQRPQPQAPPQPPQHPGQPARIDQVRAELDELSDYLRRSDGHDGGDHGHGHGRGGR
ncbi:hypothetical protein [Streptomyces hirsutus]|uniref:hypothetical protein n=1 Tax=Streptomyces hirsutus TaxID=35620 RepID=UPI0006E19FB7|nr:hypothetical protein [Streptomyces hirsutus]